MRIGQGIDVHRFGAGDHVIIGGVRIAHHRGLIAHSDGDVLLHALADALLGAAGLGDIGHWFPDNDPAYANADSRELLRKVVYTVNQRDWVVTNVDATIIAQRPKMAPHIKAMCTNISSDLAINDSAVNVKATTTEGLGAIGREEGIAAQAVVLLEQAVY